MVHHNKNQDQISAFLGRLIHENRGNLPVSCGKLENLLEYYNGEKALEKTSGEFKSYMDAHELNSGADVSSVVKALKEVIAIIDHVSKDNSNNIPASVVTFQVNAKNFVAETLQNPLPLSFSTDVSNMKNAVAAFEKAAHAMLDVQAFKALDGKLESANKAIVALVDGKDTGASDATLKELIDSVSTKVSDVLSNANLLYVPLNTFDSTDSTTEMSTNLSEVSPRITILLESVKSAPAEVIFDINYILADINQNEPNSFGDHLVTLDTALNTQYERLDSKMHYLDYKAIVLECANDLIGVIEY